MIWARSLHINARLSDIANTTYIVFYNSYFISCEKRMLKSSASECESRINRWKKILIITKDEHQLLAPHLSRGEMKKNDV